MNVQRNTSGIMMGEARGGGGGGLGWGGGVLKGPESCDLKFVSAVELGDVAGSLPCSRGQFSYEARAERRIGGKS